MAAARARPAAGKTTSLTTATAGRHTTILSTRAAPGKRSSPNCAAIGSPASQTPPGTRRNPPSATPGKPTHTLKEPPPKTTTGTNLRNILRKQAKALSPRGKGLCLLSPVGAGLRARPFSAPAHRPDRRCARLAEVGLQPAKVHRVD